jgi:hypothetical protein
MQNLSITAATLNIIAGSDRRGHMPFSGVLVHLDKISDAPPSGSNGKKILVTLDAGKKALSTLTGMGVSTAANFCGHDPKRKIGIISSAQIVGNAVLIAGSIFAKDFPEIASTIRQLKSALGFSFEAQRISVANPGSAVLVITDLTFTGAAILLKDKAAYQSTSLAASAGASAGDRSPDTRIIPMDYVQTNVFPAKTPLKPFGYGFTSPKGLAHCLSAIGFALPGTVTALAASGQPLGRSGMKISVFDLDQKLKEYDIPTSKRLQLKCEMQRQGLL